MILAVDVDYRKSGAYIAGVAFHHWFDPVASEVYTGHVLTVAEYESGAFYQRELPCILELLGAHQLRPSCVIVDGFVHLGADQRPGLGMHLYNALGGLTSVIGVAKKPFAGVSPDCEVLRGQSKKPVFVTSVGCSLDEAKNNIQFMAGSYRIPTLLKLADTTCRYGCAPISAENTD